MHSTAQHCTRYRVQAPFSRTSASAGDQAQRTSACAGFRKEKPACAGDQALQWAVALQGERAHNQMQRGLGQHSGLGQQGAWPHTLTPQH